MEKMEIKHKKLHGTIGVVEGVVRTVVIGVVVGLSSDGGGGGGPVAVSVKLET